MENPFAANEKVLTKIKGSEVEVTVRLTFNNEVQVKCPDGSLRWRTAKTVWRPPAASDAASPTPEPAPEVEHPAQEAAPSDMEAAASDAPNAAVSEMLPQPVVAPQLTVCSGEIGVKLRSAKRKKRK